MVLVCHDHKFIFLKTRKTAGTSIELLLEPLCMPADHVVKPRTNAIFSEKGIVGRRYLQDIPPGQPGYNVWRGHMTAKSIRNELGWWKWKTYQKITSVRNPFDRAVSYFYWTCDQEGTQLPPTFSERKECFRSFLLAGRMKRDEGVVKLRNKYVVQQAVRYENLQEDLSSICRKLNLPIDPNQLGMTNQNKSKRKRDGISAHFDNETTSYVCRKMSWVFENHGYSTNPQDCDVAREVADGN